MALIASLFQFPWLLIVEFKVKIRRIELVQTNVTIFTTTGVSLAVGVEGQRVDRTEMALDAAKFFFKYQMEETSIEFTDTRRSRCHVHGVLTTSQHHLAFQIERLK